MTATRSTRFPSLCAALALAICWCGIAALPAVGLPAQDRRDDEIQKLDRVDPFTEGEAEAMRAVGVAGYGPFPWADFHTTDDIDKVLGENRILWLETKHFRIGFSLGTSPLPQVSEERKAVQAECRDLHKMLRSIPAKPKRLGPWLHLHLYAQRCERVYAEFQQLIGVTDDDFANPGSEQHGKLPGKGPYLGLPDKFLLLLFQKKSDMARYMDRFCGLRVDDSMRHYHQKTNQQLLCVSAEGMEGFDASGMHAHVVYGLWHCLMDGYNGYHYALPPWFVEGVAHYYSRRVPTRFLNVRIKDDESVSQDDQNEWTQKVFRRARHEGACIPFEKMASWATWEEMGYHAHAQSWSRIDFLMSLDARKVGHMLVQQKSVPSNGDYDGQSKQLRAMASKLVFDLFELDPSAFDEQWREWVLKTYPKRK